jgi:hypothetical protein
MNSIAMRRELYSIPIQKGAAVMHDLYSDLPPPELHANYATRLVHLWIKGDPTLDKECRNRARKWMETDGRACGLDVREDPSASAAAGCFAGELRGLVVTSALAVERNGFFLELFTRDVREAEWTEVATLYIDALTEEL